MDVRMLFAIDEAAELLLECGFKKPISTLGISDKQQLQALLLGYHCLLKVKSEMDQFREGLASLGVLKCLSDEKVAPLMKSLFLPLSEKLTAG